MAVSVAISLALGWEVVPLVAPLAVVPPVEASISGEDLPHHLAFVIEVDLAAVGRLLLLLEGGRAHRLLELGRRLAGMRHLLLGGLHLSCPLVGGVARSDAHDGRASRVTAVGRESLLAGRPTLLHLIVLLAPVHLAELLLRLRGLLLLLVRLRCRGP